MTGHSINNEILDVLLDIAAVHSSSNAELKLPLVMMLIDQAVKSMSAILLQHAAVCLLVISIEYLQHELSTLETNSRDKMLRSRTVNWMSNPRDDGFHCAMNCPHFLFRHLDQRLQKQNVNGLKIDSNDNYCKTQVGVEEVQ